VIPGGIEAGGDDGAGMGSGAFPVRAEINVTSLVDVAFTLLIIFMITAPILQGGVEVAVPRAPASPLENQTGVIVSVDREGQVYLDETAVNLRELSAAISEIAERRPGVPVYVRGDEGAGYGVVLRVIGTLNDAGIDAVSLVARPDAEEGG
jgi:biopolymer transport protein ExbD/biopolymer transport protein TolR